MSDRLQYLRNCTPEERENEETQAEYEALEFENTAEMKTQKIGDISEGIDGRDQFVLLTRIDASLTMEQAEGYMLRRCYVDSREEAGGYFCHSVTALPVPAKDNEFVIIVHHRYDV